MREDCKNFQSRTYPSGEVARWCVLDLAPEAPWRCPEECPKFERRLADVGWHQGSLGARPAPADPPGLGERERVSALLDEAEMIVNTAGPEIVADIEEHRARSRGGRTWWDRLRTRFRR